MNFFDLMNKFRCDKTADYTHVSMLPHGELYRIPDEDMEVLYGQYSKCIEKGAKFGILERPKDIGPMLVDVDIAKKSTALETLYTKDRVLAYATAFQKYLITHTDITDHTKLECYVLEKKPYLDGKGNCKNGFHLHFPTVWMTRAHRSFITKLVKNTNIEQDYETLDDSAVRNNWLLYGSRKTEKQGTYKVKYIVETDGTILKKRSSSILVKTLSIRNNQSKVTTSILKSCLPKETKRQQTKPTSPLDDSLLTRCMDALDSSRADDYHDWIRIGCILYTIDKENGFQRWDDFSKQSYKYDENYLYKTWSRFKNYNYTIGTLIYMAREDDEDCTVGEPKVERQTCRKLVKVCREKGIRGYMTMSFEELCDVLDLPRQKKDESCKNIRTPIKVTLVETTSGETQTFKSIYSAAKSIGRNPGSISAKKNTLKTLKSKFNDSECRVEI